MTIYEHILQANRDGLSGQYEYGAPYYTPILKVAFRWGEKGVDLSKQPIVRGHRYGEIGEGISTNYRDDVSECGLSLAALDGEREVSSAMWFCDRRKVAVEGILLPKKGSDGEPLVIPTKDIDIWD